MSSRHPARCNPFKTFEIGEGLFLNWGHGVGGMKSGLPFSLILLGQFLDNLLTEIITDLVGYLWGGESETEVFVSLFGGHVHRS